MLPQITAIDSHPGNGNILRMDDPELLKYPIAYLSEPGFWFPSDEEAAGLRRYLEKGGFLIVDDFHYRNEWVVFERAMRRVLPDGQDRSAGRHAIRCSIRSSRSSRSTCRIRAVWARWD